MNGRLPAASVARARVWQSCLWRAERTGVSWPLAEGVDEAALEERLYPRRPPGIEVHPTPDFEWIERELKRKHVTRRQLWREYLARHPEGLKYTAFCVKYRRWRTSRTVTLALTHTPGDRLFVDYAGDPACYSDPGTGEVHKAWLFVAVWPYSAYLYAEVTRTQQSADWLGAHVRALEAFGAVPRAIVPDNCSTAVKKALRYDPQLNRSYAELAAHYALAVLPTRVTSTTRQSGGGKCGADRRAARAPGRCAIDSSSAWLSSTLPSRRSLLRSTPRRSRSAPAAARACSRPRSAPRRGPCPPSATSMASGRSALECTPITTSRLVEPTTRCTTA